jgi:CDP-4-dehydro-6-deoxyglucose reductase
LSGVAGTGEEAAHRVRLVPSGRIFEVPPGQGILAAGLGAGIRMPYGCRMGTCQSCRGRILQGRADLGAAHPTYLPQQERNKGYALLCQARPLTDLVIEVEELPALAQPFRSPAIVKAISFPAPDVAVEKFRLPLHRNMAFAAGQYVDFLLKEGARRSYSIANPPKAEGVIDLEFHIRHMPGGLLTDHVFGGLKPRDKMDFEGPLGTFFLRDSKKPTLLLASGTGYAPIRSILLETLPRERDRQFVLYWGARTRKDLYLLDEADGLARTYPNFRFVPVLSEARAADGWTRRTGLVHRAVIEDLPGLATWQVYACGTPAMVEAARSDFAAARGHPASEFFSDSFVSQADLAAVVRET